MSTLTPNMSLNVPTIGVDSGLAWEQYVNANSSILDGHNHSNGSGVQINPAGININADLAFNGNNATTLRSTRYSAQVSPLAGASDLGCLYVSGVDLYFNDENGNQIQITSGGTVNATSSGISSGTATASFSASVLVVNSASNTPANVRCASVVLGNTGVSGSNYVTLSPVNSLALNYSITLPLTPASTKMLIMDNVGNITASYDVDNSTIQVSANNLQVKDQGITQAKKAIRTTGSTVSAGGVAISSSSGSFSTTSGTLVDITNLSVTITTLGNPVVLQLIPDGTQSSSIGMGSATETGILAFLRGSSVLGYSASFNGSFSLVSVFTDPVAAGTYTYKIQGRAASGTFSCIKVVLVAYEL